MSAPADRYRELTAGGPGAWLAKRAGLPRPAALRRHTPGQPLLSGPALVVAVAGSGLAPAVAGLLQGAGADVVPGLEPSPGERLGAVVVDATGASQVAHLAEVRAALAPAIRRLAGSGRVLVVGTDPAHTAGVEAAAVQQGLEGLVRSVGKELRGGATANLVRVPRPGSHAAGGDDPGGAPADGSGGAAAGAVGDAAAVVAAASSTLLFLLSARSAFVSGQVVGVGWPVGAAHPSAATATGADGDRPLAGQVAVVTGAARGIGAAIAEVLAQRGAHVVGVDVPAAGAALAAVANRVGGTALQLDITAADAPERLARHLVQRHGGADVVVHNAGITRDRLLVNLDPVQWDAVLAVNLAAQLAITSALLDTDGALRTGARVVAVSSTSGLAGNRGQSSYAASKAGVAGMVRALAPVLAERGMTANAVAPGFIETEMTARMPALTREVARRVNSLQQGGLPVDVAETIAWLAEPGSAAVTGQVVRVCGQNLVGA